MPRLGVMLAVLVAFTLPAAAQAPASAPLPPERPAESSPDTPTPPRTAPVPQARPVALRQADVHADRLITRLALRFGMDDMASIPRLSLEDNEEVYAVFYDRFARLAGIIRPYALRIPLWVTELERTQMVQSLEAFANCNKPLENVPQLRPENTIGVQCLIPIHAKSRKPDVARQDLFYVQEVRVGEILAYRYHDGIAQTPSWWPLVSTQTAAQQSSR